MFAMTACNNGTPITPSNENSESQNNNLSHINLTYMNNLMVNFNGQTALGIKKDSNSNAKVKTMKKISRMVKPLSVVFSDDDVIEENDNQTITEKYYLYYTTQTYSNGVVDYESDSIKKVTFKRNDELTEDVYDNDGNLIDSNTTVTQDDIAAQVNRLFVTKEYTFIQFVALVESSGNYNYYDENNEIKTEYIELRPDGLTYDENGVAEFDKSNYYSSALSQSFVIDNTTGYIYKIDGFTITEFHNGLIKISGNNSFFNIYIQDDNLNITDVLPNKDVTISNVYKDTFGWTFVANDKIDDIDNAKKIIYTTDSEHKRFASNGVIYNIAYYPGTLMEYISDYYKDGVLKSYDKNYFIKGLRELFNNSISMVVASYFGVEIYGLTVQSGGFGVLISSNNSHIKNYRSYAWLDENYDYIYGYNEEGKIVYIEIDLIECTTIEKGYAEDDFILLSDKKLTPKTDFYLSIGNDKYKIKNVFYYAGINGTTYYQVVKNNNGLELKELVSTLYTSNTFILQPINK